MLHFDSMWATNLFLVAFYYPPGQYALRARGAKRIEQMWWVFWGIIALWLGLWPLYLVIALLVFIIKVIQQVRRDFKLINAQVDEQLNEQQALMLQIEIHHYHHFEDERRYVTIDGN
jgi:hypothetical protein